MYSMHFHPLLGVPILLHLPALPPPLEKLKVLRLKEHPTFSLPFDILILTFEFAFAF